MTDEKTRVLIVDDSALVRQILEAVLSRDPDITVVGTARDGLSVLPAIEKHRPHVVTLDLEMPGLSGLEVLERLRGSGVAVVVVASPREAARDLTVRALTLGAFDFVAKPTTISDGLAALSEELVAKVKAAHSSLAKRAASRTAPPAPRSSPPAPRSSPPAPRPSPRAIVPARPAGTLAARATPGDLVIAIGSSTGGPEALVAVLSRMPKDCPPIVIVQHMPEKFTAKFAQRLDGTMACRVKEAADGDLLRPGLVLLAPGTTHHMRVFREPRGLVVRLDTGATVMHHRPSVDHLFNSCAAALGRSAVGVILTGMGSDGARGLLAMRQAGAQTIAQDEKTSLVYGMPMEAAAMGGASYVLPLGEIGTAALRLAQPGRRVSAA